MMGLSLPYSACVSGRRLGAVGLASLIPLCNSIIHVTQGGYIEYDSNASRWEATSIGTVMNVHVTIHGRTMHGPRIRIRVRVIERWPSLTWLTTVATAL